MLHSRGYGLTTSSTVGMHEAKSGSLLAILVFVGLLAVVVGVAGLALSVANDAQPRACPPDNQNCPDIPPP